jgi:acyl-CoA synthetase (AMP-forming)/AMP-acid ligase II
LSATPGADPTTRRWRKATASTRTGVSSPPGRPPRPPACAISSASRDLDQACLDHIARFKRPKDYRFVDALPTNNYGKVVKRELRDRLRAETK